MLTIPRVDCKLHHRPLITRMFRDKYLGLRSVLELFPAIVSLVVPRDAPRRLSEDDEDEDEDEEDEGDDEAGGKLVSSEVVEVLPAEGTAEQLRRQAGLLSAWRRSIEESYALAYRRRIEELQGLLEESESRLEDL